MKRSVILGSIVSVLLLLLLPSIPAIHYTTVFNAQKTQIIKENNEKDWDQLREKFQSGTLSKEGTVPGIIFNLLFGLLIRLVNAALAPVQVLFFIIQWLLITLLYIINPPMKY